MRCFVSFGIERSGAAQGVSGRFRTFHESPALVGDTARRPCGMAARQSVDARPTLVELDRHHPKVSLASMRGPRAWPQGNAKRVSGNGHDFSGGRDVRSTVRRNVPTAGLLLRSYPDRPLTGAMDSSAIVRHLSTGARWNEMPVMNTFHVTVTDNIAGCAEIGSDA
jgi:hypothetical protein